MSTIDPIRWQQLSALLDTALDLGDDARTAWLQALRARDPALGEEMARLLKGAAAAVGDGPSLEAASDHESPADGPTRPAAFAWLLAEALLQEVAAPQRLGQRFGAWRLLRKIGEGGMGEVWLAQRDDGLYDAQAAIKLLRGDLDTARLAQRFARERALLARLEHPAVARLLDAGIEAGQAFLVLELVAGRPMSEHARVACPTVAQRVDLLLQVAQAVDHAHARLIVHRDLKPSNVMVSESGQAKLLDFGVAALLHDTQQGDSDLTRQTGRGLTLGYAAPEQVLGAPIGTAADVFSLGVMLFELLSGELPFGARDAARLAVEHAVLQNEPQRLSAVLAQGAGTADTLAPGPGRPQDAHRGQGDLEAIAAKALRKNPDERYGSVQSFIDDLRRWQRLLPVEARRDDRRHRTQLWLRRNLRLVAAGSAVLISLSAGLALATWQWQQAQQAARQSAQISNYLTELLASASPELHGGNVPTVLDVLQASRQSLPGKFKDDPETRLQLLQVLSNTYHDLGRYDLALPLFEERIALSTQLHGAQGAATLAARWQRGRALQIQNQCDKAVAELEPLLNSFGADSEEMRLVLYTLNACYSRLGRSDDAERVLARAGTLTEQRYASGTLQWLSHQNHVHVLRANQGRLRESLAAILRTQPWWQDPAPELRFELLIYRRNAAVVQMRLSEYEGLDARMVELIAAYDRLMGPASEAGLRAVNEWAQSFSDRGQPQRAFALRTDALERAQRAGVRNPAQLLPLLVQRLLAATQLGVEPVIDLRQQTQARLTQTVAERQALGYPRAEAWLALSRTAMLLGDAGLAQQALDTLADDTGLNLASNLPLAMRLTTLQGQLARLQGDLVASQQLLLQNLQWQLARPRADMQVLPVWRAGLEVACGLAQQGDPAAAQALTAAAAWRPPGLPADHPLDLAAARLQQGLTQSPEQAREAARALGRTLL